MSWRFYFIFEVVQRNHSQSHHVNIMELVFKYFRCFLMTLFYRSVTLMDSNWSMNRKGVRIKKFFSLNITFYWHIGRSTKFFMCFSKFNVSSIATSRSSTESFGFIIMLLIDGLFCKFLFVITIVWNLLGLTIAWFDISNQSLEVSFFSMKTINTCLQTIFTT